MRKNLKIKHDANFLDCCTQNHPLMFFNLKKKLGLKLLRHIKQSVLAIIFSGSFTHYQAEQLKKGVICVQSLLEIHQTEPVESISKAEQLHLYLF